MYMLPFVISDCDWRQQTLVKLRQLCHNGRCPTYRLPFNTSGCSINLVQRYMLHNVLLPWWYSALSWTVGTPLYNNYPPAYKYKKCYYNTRWYLSKCNRYKVEYSSRPSKRNHQWKMYVFLVSNTESGSF